MAVYLLHMLSADGHVVVRHEVDCASDVEAISKARQLFPSSPFEVWLGAECILREVVAAASAGSDDTT